ncbi:unnamed protein product [Tilletia controversa]|nr:unnamed protein product [Tilletia controversa]CAD6921523.1 unnamed protein product [Tilletia controversa]
MPNSRGPASARPDPSVAAGSRLPKASGSPSTPLCDLMGVRNASQVTPLCGNVRKRQNDALLTEQQQTPARPSPGGRSAADLSSLTFQHRGRKQPLLHRSLPPLPHVRRPDRLIVPKRPGTHLDLVQLDTHQLQSALPALGAASLTYRSGCATTASRLLSSTTSNAFDVAARGGIQDNRIFVKLPEDHAARKAETERFWRLRDTISTGLSRVGFTDAVSSVDAVKTGLALTLTRGCKTSEVMQHADFLKRLLEADDVVTRKPAILRVVGNVPVRVGGPVVDAKNGSSLEREIAIALNAKLSGLLSTETTQTPLVLDVFDFFSSGAPSGHSRVVLQPPPVTSAGATVTASTHAATPLAVANVDHRHIRQRSIHAQYAAKTVRVDVSHSVRVDMFHSAAPALGLISQEPAAARRVRFSTTRSILTSFILPAGQRLHQIKRAAYNVQQQAIKALQSSTTTNPTTNP